MRTVIAANRDWLVKSAIGCRFLTTHWSEIRGPDRFLEQKCPNHSFYYHWHIISNHLVTVNTKDEANDFLLLPLAPIGLLEPCHGWFSVFDGNGMP